MNIKEIVESNAKFVDKKYLFSSSNIYSSLSGSERKYEPYKWNNNENIKSNHNCYAYVLNQIASRRLGKPQPGYFSNYPALSYSDYNCLTFYERLKKDVPSLYLIDFDTSCKKGYYKGFIALDRKKYDTDYHFYRQDKNKLWSHKPGRTDVVNIDAAGKLINNPFTANRKYKYYNYGHPCFFFCINDKMAKAVSRTTG